MEHKKFTGDGKPEALHIDDDGLKPITTDDAQLAAIGLKEELERRFSVWSLTALVLCLMGTWEALGSTMAQALLSGGAPCLFYN